MQDHCALDFSDHLSIVSSPITGRYILNALDPAHALPPPCTLVLPAV
jgi:triacylglycerol lipase